MRLIALLTLLAVTACANTVLPVTDGRISTEEEFIATAAGRKVVGPNTTFAISKNGRLHGVTNGIEIEGRWVFQDGFFCRSLSKPEGAADDCQVWEIRNRTLIITREKGQGERLVYPLPAPADAVR